MREWTPQQQAFILFLADPGETRQQKDFAQEYGLRDATLSEWKRKPELWDEVNKLRRRVTDPYLKDIMWAHIKKAKSGDVQAIKLFYEFRGELIQKHENLYPDGIPNNITLTIEDASLDDDEPDA